MKKAQLEQKPRAGSDSSEKKQRLDQDQNHPRERSFTDVIGILSKKLKVNKKDASTNTTPLAEMYVQPTVPPELPPKMNYYYLNEALNKVEVSSEHVYQEVILERSMNVESDLWMTRAADEQPNQETPWEENEDDSDEDSEEEDSEEEEDAVDGPLKTMPTHKRNTSGWSLGSFHIGITVELMNELLTGEEWAQFFEDKEKISPDIILPASKHSDEPFAKIQDFETKQEMPKDAVHGKSTEEGSKSKDSSIDDILKSVKIIEEKEETPKVLKEEPEPLPHILPPKLTPSSGAGIDKLFRSSVFYRYNLPPPGQQPLPETPKSGPLILDKIKAKLRKSSVEEAQPKETEK